MAARKEVIRKKILATKEMGRIMADYFYELDNAVKTGEKKVGTGIEVLPKIQADGNEILLDFDFEHSAPFGFTDGLPETDTVHVKGSVLVPNGGTLLLGGMKLTQREKKDSQIVDLNLFVLIKVEKLEVSDKVEGRIGHQLKL